MKRTLKMMILTILIFVSLISVLANKATALIVMDENTLISSVLYNYIDGDDIILVNPKGAGSLSYSDIQTMLQNYNKTVANITSPSNVAYQTTETRIATGSVVTTSSGDTFKVCLFGDANGDGYICQNADVLVIQNDYLHRAQATGVYKKAADLCLDGELNVKDIQRMLFKSRDHITTGLVDDYPDNSGIHYAIFKADNTEVARVKFTVADGLLGSQPAVPNKNGYTGSWPTYNLNVENDVTINANYTLNTYQINYVLNGGTFESTPKTTYTVTDANKNLSMNVVKAGYVFEGWYENSNLTGEKIYNVENRYEDITVYAKYLEANYVTNTNKYFVTLKDAFIGAESGNTIKPTKNVVNDTSDDVIMLGSELVTNKSLKLNLEGKTINLNQFIENYGTLDIYSSVNGGKIIGTNSFIEDGTGTLVGRVIRNFGTFTTNATNNGANTLEIINNSTADYVDVVANHQIAIINENTTLKVDNVPADENSTRNRYGVINRGTLTINGATIINAPSETTSSIAIGISNATGEVDETIIVQGNTYIEANHGAILNNGVTTSGVSHEVIIIDGTIISNLRSGVENYGVVTIGTNEIGTPNVSTTTPSISGSTFGVYNSQGGTFNFYDGEIKGALNESISREPNATPEGYTVRKTFTISRETSILGNTYTITLDLNGGSYNNSTSNSTVTATYGQDVNLGYPVRNGYYFAGWSNSNNTIYDKNILKNAASPSEFVTSAYSTNELGGWRIASTTGGSRTIIDITNPPEVGITKGFDIPGQGNAQDVSQDKIYVTAGKTYTMSVWAKGTGSLKIQLAAQSPWTQKLFTLNNVSTWTKYSWTFTAGNESGQATMKDGYVNAYFGNAGATGTDIQICGMKLVEEDTFTDLLWENVPSTTTSPTLVAHWIPQNVSLTINHYVHDLGTNTYTLNSTDYSDDYSTDETVTVADLQATIEGFTYEAGYLTGDTTKPTSGAVTSVTVSADGSTVINLYYRRNYLYVQYNVNGGTLTPGTSQVYGVLNGLVTTTETGTNTKFWRGVYGSKVGGVTSSTYAINTAGLENYNNAAYINISKSGYVGQKEAEWCLTADGTGTAYSQTISTYNANDLATAAGGNLANGDVTITLYVNWLVPNYTEYNGSTVVKYYATLPTAFSGVTSGNTIKATFSGTSKSEAASTLASGKTAILDLNGKTLTMTGTITNNGTLDIYNTSSTEGKINSSAANTIKNSGTLTMNKTAATNKVTVTNTTTAPGNRVLLNDASKTATLNTNVTFAYSQNIVQPETEANRYLITNNGTLNVAGADLTNTKSATTKERVVNNTSTGKLNITSGTVKSYGISIYSSGTATGTSAPAIKVTGGTVESTNSNAIYNDGAGDVYVTGGNIKVGSTVENAIYNNKAGAVTIGASGSTSTTSPDITGKVTGATTASGLITINGGKITATTTQAVLSKGSITINGGSISSSSSYTVYIQSNPDAVLTVSGGTIDSKGSYYALTTTNTNGQSGTINVTGGTIKKTGTGGTAAVVNNQYGTTTITGGTITSSGGPGVYTSTGTITVGNNSNAVSTTVPSITGTTYGVAFGSSATFNFYDGVIKGASGKSITDSSGNAKLPTDKPVGYTVRKTTANSIETAVLGNTYTVNFYQGNATGTAGSTLLGTQTVTYGTAVNLTTYANLGGVFPYGTADHNANSSHVDYNWEFAGWCTTETGTSRNYTNGQSYTHNTEGNLNLYAVGKKTFEFSGGVAPTASFNSVVQYWNPYSTAAANLTSITIPALPSDKAISGWTFIGYKAGNNSANSTVTFATSVAGTSQKPAYNTYRLNRSVYSRTVTINYNANGGSGTTSATTATQYYNSGRGTGSANIGATLSTPSFTLRANSFTKTGYTFSKWADGSTSGTQYDAGATYNTWTPAVDSSTITKTMYAIWTANKYKVTLNNQNANTTGTTAVWYYYKTTSTQNGTTVYYYSNEACTTALTNGYTITVPKKSGYTFGGYYTATNGEGTQYINASGNFVNNIYSTVANNTTLYAKWTEKTYTLTVKPNNGTYNNSTSNTTYTLKYSDVQSIPNPTRSGYTFVGWSELSNSMTGDPSFSLGTNSVAKYANSGGAQVTVTRKTKSSDNPIGNYELKITNAGGVETKPGLGGFVQSSGTVSASQSYIHLFVAKLPTGYYFQQANNNMGTGSTITWLTPQEGTGSFETYAYQVNTGSESGSSAFSNFGHVFISTSPVRNANPATASTAVTAYLAYSNIFNVTSNNNAFGMVDGTGVLTAQWINANYAEYNGTKYIKNYSTLEDALSGVTSGRIIKPLKDITDESTNNPTLASGKTATIDLNGYTINISKNIQNNGNLTISGSSGEIISSVSVIKNGTDDLLDAKLKITGGTLNSTGSTGIYNYACTAGTTPTIEVTGGTIKGQSGDAIESYYYGDDIGVIKVTGGTIEGRSYGIYVSSGRFDVIVTGGNIKGNMVTGVGPDPRSLTVSGNPIIEGHDHSVKSYNGTITINGGTLTNDSSYTVYGDYVTINGGTISNTSSAGSTTVCADYTATITGGTISAVCDWPAVSAPTVIIGTNDSTVTSVDNSSAVEPRITGKKYGVSGTTINFYDGVVKATDGDAFKDDVTETPTGYAPVLTVSGTQHTATLAPITVSANYGEFANTTEKIPNNYYANLATAFTNAQTGTVIRALKTQTDSSSSNPTVAADKSLIFDLSGYTVTMNKSIVNNGTLDIYSSVDGSQINSSVASSINNYGTMTFNGTKSTYTLLVQYTGTTLGARVLVNQANATMTVKNKTTITFSQAQSQGTSTNNRYLMTNYGLFRLQGGTLRNNLSSTTYDAGILNYAADARVVVSSGTIETYGISINNNAGTGDTNSTSAVAVSGGTITSSNGSAIYNQQVATIYITGGTITGTSGIYNKDNTAGNIYIYGYDVIINGTSSTGIRGVTGTITTNTSSSTYGAKGVKITGKTYGISVTSGSINIKSGLVTATNGVGLYATTGTVTLGTNDTSVISSDSTQNTMPYITGTTYGVQVTSGTLNFYDGIVKGAYTNNVGKSLSKVPNNIPVDCGVIKTQADDVETASLKKYNYAEYNGTTFVAGYDTLADAFDNVTSNNTIKPTTWKADYTYENDTATLAEGKVVTLDLGTKQIKCQNMGSCSIYNKGTLTIKGDYGSQIYSNITDVISNFGTLNIQSGTIVGGYWGVITNNGTLNITGGTVSGTSSNSSLHDPAIQQCNGTLTISGGTVQSTNFSAIEVGTQRNSTVIVTGGLIKSSSSYPTIETFYQYNAGGTLAANVEIRGGTITNTSTGYAIDIKNSVYGSTNITGGTVKSSYGTAIHVYTNGILNLGTNDSTVTSIDNTTAAEPRITGAVYGVLAEDHTYFSFYDGVIKGKYADGVGQSISGSIYSLPNGYTVNKTVSGSVETATLVASSGTNSSGGEVSSMMMTPKSTIKGGITTSNDKETDRSGEQVEDETVDETDRSVEQVEDETVDETDRSGEQVEDETVDEIDRSVEQVEDETVDETDSSGEQVEDAFSIEDKELPGVAQIDDIIFNDLQEAIDSSEPEDEVILLRDIELENEILVDEDKEIKINLNEKSIIGKSEITINNKGILHIVSSGIIRNDTENGIAIYNSGTVDIENEISVLTQNNSPPLVSEEEAIVNILIVENKDDVIYNEEQNELITCNAIIIHPKTEMILDESNSIQNSAVDERPDLNSIISMNNLGIFNLNNENQLWTDNKKILGKI